MTKAWLALAILAAACSPTAAQSDTWSPIELTATPISMPATVGDLQGRVGFVLDSPQARFGGLSDLHVFEDGRLLAITDGGEWLLADLLLDPETGLPNGIANARMALMRDENGEPFPNKESSDAEDLAILADGRVAVSFERSQSIRIYDVLGAGPSAPAQPGPPLADADSLNGNRGLEALTVLPGGDLLVGAEMGRRGGASPIWRVSLGAEEPTEPISRLRTPPGYGLTAWDWDETGQQIVAVQRFFAPGLGIRIRLVTAALPADGRFMQVTERAAFAPPQPVDNVEGVSVRSLPGTGSRLFLLSDDNYSEDQQTLLLVFDWRHGQPEAD